MPAIDDFPSLGVSRLRAAGVILPHMKTATVAFPDGPAFTVGLQHIHFPNGGGWSFFVCPCGHRCRTLRLFRDAPACRSCLKAKGLRYRVEDMARPKRAAYVASGLRARLACRRLNLRPGRTLERRSRLEAALWRAEYVAQEI
jgi:hypothetical protein